MAEPTKAELQKELEALKAALLEKEEQIKALEQSLENAKKTGTVAKPVPGKLKVSFKDPKGKNKTVTIRFKDGRINVMLRDGAIVPSNLLMDLANGKDLDEGDLKQYPALQAYDKHEAVDYLTELRAKRVGFLEDV